LSYQEWITELLDIKNLSIEGVYNLTFEVIATWITYKLLFKPMIIKQVKKELEKE
jgi:hypothetical protein